MMIDDASDSVVAARELAKELTNLVELARALATCGRAIDLIGLEHQVGLLCAKSLDLPPDQGRRLRPRLIALSGSIDALAQTLAARVAPST